jgi:hypothetical protein
VLRPTPRVSGVFTGLGLLAQWMKFTLALVANIAFGLAIMAGGWFISPKAWRAVRRFALDMNVLMTVAVAGAMAIGEFSEGAAVTFLFALSELLEAFSLARARKAVQALMQLTPETALLKDAFSSRTTRPAPSCAMLYEVRRGRADFSLHVTLQHREQFPQLALTFFRISRVLDAFFSVLVNDHLGEGLQRFTHRNNLREHVWAVAILLDHPLDRGDLAGNLAKAKLERPLFVGRMDVRVRWHRPSLPGLR